MDSHLEAVASVQKSESIGTFAWLEEQSRLAAEQPADGVKAREAFLRLLSNVVTPELKVIGFRKKQQRFVRWVGEYCQVVEYQGDRYSTAMRFKFRVNLGILSKKVERPMGLALSDEKFPREYDCNWRIGLGDLILPKPADWWWALDLRADPVAVVDEATRFLLGYGIPFLEWAISPEGVRVLDRLLVNRTAKEVVLSGQSVEGREIISKCFAPRQSSIPDAGSKDKQARIG